MILANDVHQTIMSNIFIQKQHSFVRLCIQISYTPIIVFLLELLLHFTNICIYLGTYVCIPLLWSLTQESFYDQKTVSF